MTRVDQFNSFYSSTFGDALQVTYAVCGDRQVAFESTVDEQAITVGVTSLDGRVGFAFSATAPLTDVARQVADELGVLNRELG